MRGTSFVRRVKSEARGLASVARERLPIEQAQDLRPGTPGGATVRLRAVAEVRQVAAEHEGIDLLHAKRLGGPGVDAAEERVGAMPVQPGEHAGDLAVGVEDVVALARQLGGRAGEGVLRLQLEEAEGAGLAIEDDGVDVGANVATVSRRSSILPALVTNRLSWKSA